jgi:outer membrane protein assembly factor BamB
MSTKTKVVATCAALVGALLASPAARAVGEEAVWSSRLDLGFEKTYGGPITADRGKIFAAGSGPFRFSPSSDAAMVVRAFDDHTGEFLWSSACLGTRWDDQALHIAASGGMVFVAGTGNLNTSYPGKATLVCALDADTGKRLWEDRRDGEGSTLAIVANASRVLVSAGGLWSGHPILRAYDPASGTVVWQVEAGGSASPYSNIGGSIAVRSGRVYAMARDDAGALRLHAYELATGAPSWETEPIGDLGSAQSLHVAASAGVVFTAVADGAGRRLSAFDAGTGAPLWQVDPVGSVGALAAEGGRLFASGAGPGLRAYAAATGEVLWDVPGGGAPIATGGGTISIAGSNYGTRLRTLDAASGALLMEVASSGGAVVWSAGRVFTSGTAASQVYLTHTEWIVAGYEIR